MTKAEPSNHSDENNDLSPERIRRGRRMALLLFAVGFGPMILATVLYYTGWMNPTGQSNHGQLIQPPASLQELQLEGADGTILAQRFGPQLEDPEWMLMVVAGNCGATCEELLYLARQVNIALGKNAARVNRAAWLGNINDELAGRWDNDYSSMERLSIAAGAEPSWPAGVDPSRKPRILLVDPFGNIIMHYGSEHTGKQILSDLKHLLKISQIG
ncbi:hypothetical protein [Marinobacter sp.]|uniref:hypothetical protein n=1 Tax=Marinobacter sp. TaxID=50741 RepID=UPI002B4823C5|nr:hypothetical protein [Marinobacter sp.]HKK56603.1 hypothetical protein [Marinobacter sp.]